MGEFPTINDCQRARQSTGTKVPSDNPSHVHPLRSLVTGITQFASENRQKENSGSKFRKTVGQILSDSHEL